MRRADGIGSGVVPTHPGASEVAPLELVTADPVSLDLEAEPLARLVARTGPLAVVDLETTGLAGEPGSEPIEFGAVLLDPGVVSVTTAHSLIRPRASLPRPIRRLTGLSDADLEPAPALSSVAPAVRQLLAGRTLVAHNAAFERWFLTRFVSPRLESARYLDTQDLLALTHPDAPDLRLETFTRGLLGRDERHRALEDALDTVRVISRLGVGAGRNAPRYDVARRALEVYAPESDWQALLGKESGAESVAPHPAYVAIEPSDVAPVPFDEDAIAAVLADVVRCRRFLPGYRAREAQIDLARRVVRNLAGGGVLLLEGGTGVGKSLAYLAAAIPFAIRHAEDEHARHTPVILSTRTKLLQDQLLQKDIAAAARLLGYPELRALSIKGRANYACKRRLEGVLAEGREPTLFPEDRMAHAVLLACARTRPHGEIGSLPPVLLHRFPALFGLLRRSVAARAQQCTREQCAHTPGCPLGRRRAALADAHLVVANHDLLLRWPPDYPPFAHVIADEAHELAGVADAVYALEVAPGEVLDRLDDVFGRPGERRGRPLLSPGARRGLAADAVAWRRALDQDLIALGRSLAPHAGDYGELELPDPPGPTYEGAVRAAEVVWQRLEAVVRELTRLGSEGSAALRASEELGDAARALRLAFEGTGGRAVAAFERVVHPWDRWRMRVRPVSPAGPFHERFLSGLESFAAVSASLFVAGDAFPSVGLLELEERLRGDLDRLTRPSPFDYARHMRALALEPEADLVEETAAVLADLARALGGRTLGLFTSLRRMNQVADLLTERLRSDGLDVLVPRRAGDDPNALVDRFRRSGGAVLLGARTFWQGLDIPGPELQALVIEKLPFDVPTQLGKRREARYRELGIDAFERDTLGRMLLYLKQMTGRLIRSEEDRGVVVIVEARTSQRYFARLDDALPRGVHFETASRRDLPGVLASLELGGEAGR